MSGFAGERQLTDLLKEELSVWVQINELTDKQTALLEADDVEALTESMDRRHELIEKIKGLHQESNVLMQSYISATEKGGEKSKAVEAVIAQIREKITISAQCNEKNLAIAGTMKDGYSERAGELGQKRKGIGAYALDVPYNSELYDGKG